MSQLTTFQKQRLWSLVCKLTQGDMGIWYDEDHEFDEERTALISLIEDILATPEPLPPTHSQGETDHE